MKPTSQLLRNILVVESPNKAKVISNYLAKEFGSHRWAVVSTIGHISSMCSVDPVNLKGIHRWIPEKAKLLTRGYNQLTDGDRICIATDPDREGEIIAHEVAEFFKTFGATKFERILYNEVTRTAIVEALANPTEFRSHLVDAGSCRRIVDWWFGIGASRLLRRNTDFQCLSAGRVQTPALSLVAARHQEQMDFIPEVQRYVVAKVKIGSKKVSLKLHFDKKVAIGSKSKAQRLVEHAKEHPFTVSSSEVEVKEVLPPHLDTATCLKDGSKELKVPVAGVQKGLQKLFESGAITYHRTDSTTISPTATAIIASYITETYGAEYSESPSTTAKTTAKIGTEAHEAIRPSDITMETPRDNKLSGFELRLYTFIRVRTLKANMTPPTRLLQTVMLTCDENLDYQDVSASTIKTKVVNPGSNILNNSKEVEAKLFSKLPDSIIITDVDVMETSTKPKKNLTDADIIDRLKSLGIGRPATYAATVQTLLSRNYVRRACGKNEDEVLNELIVTPEGLKANDFMQSKFKKWVNYKFTSDFEKKLDKIALGKLTRAKFLTSFRKDVSQSFAANSWTRDKFGSYKRIVRTLSL